MQTFYSLPVRADACKHDVISINACRIAGAIELQAIYVQNRGISRNIIYKL